MITRDTAIKEIFNTHGSEALYVTNTGYISRAVYHEYPNNENILYMQGSMGLAPCIGLGLALNNNKDIVVLSGDGALLMHLGITHTIRDRNLSNLFVYVLDNGCHESVGAYECSSLEDSYPGIHKIYKIPNNGKLPRVGINSLANKELFKKCL